MEEEPNMRARFRVLRKNRALDNIIAIKDECEKADFLRRISQLDY